VSAVVKIDELSRQSARDRDTSPPRLGSAAGTETETERSQDIRDGEKNVI
jgi:hypothetical protein